MPEEDNTPRAAAISLPPGTDQPPVTDAPAGTDPNAHFMDMVRSHNESSHPGADGAADPSPAPAPAADPATDDVPPEDSPEDPPADPTEGGLTEDPLAGTELPPPKKKTKADNIKNLREALRAEKTRSTGLETELSTANTKLGNVTESEEVKGLLKTRDDRIKELEPYEDLLGLYKTEGFKEAYFDSIETVRVQAEGIAADYGVEAAVIGDAFKLTNRRELNEYLAEHFDPIGVTDVRKYILDAQGIELERNKMEQNPRKAKEELITIMNRTREQAAQQTSDRLKVRMRTSWDAMLAIYTDKDSGVDTLKDIVGDTEHTTAKQELLARAEDQYGQAIGMLVASGARDVPETLMRSFASRFQLSEVTGHLVRDNAALRQEAEELRAELAKVSTYSRPMGSGSSSGRGTPASTEIATEDVAAHVMKRANDQLASR